MTASLYNVIALVESSNNNFAMRFEPGIYARPTFNSAIIQRIVAINRCSQATAKVIYSTSWGAIQMMGFNLYDPAFEYGKSVGEYMNNQLDQQAIFIRFCRRKNIMIDPIDLAASHAARNQFALMYNGSGEYEKPLIASLKHFGYTIGE
jgi:hypothetical protein